MAEETQNVLKAFLETLRASPAQASELLRSSAARMTLEVEYRQAIAGELSTIFRSTHSTHLLTESGILAEEGVLSGMIRRLGSWLAPAPPRGDALELRSAGLVNHRDKAWLEGVQLADVVSWIEALATDNAQWEEDHSELSSALVILATRVAGAGLDARLSERMPALETWGSPFLELSRIVDVFAEAYASEESSPEELEILRLGAERAVHRCMQQVERFRAEKESLGTTLHLSSSSLRMVQQLERLRLLLACTRPSGRSEAVAQLSLELCRDAAHSRPTTRFVRQKLELISYLVVGHAAQKGSKYAARTPSEYRAFWFKSALGGLFVAFFASLKLHLSHPDMAPVPQAFLYGVNYALCFVLIYLTGATLATKQPALTASRMAASLEGGQESKEPFPELVRAIWRSQFVSFLGNIGGAALFTAIFALLYSLIIGEALVSPEEAQYLADKLHPWKSGTIFYAAVAGVMLSMAGFIAGFIDNAVVFHRVRERVLAGGGIFRLLPKGIRERMAGRIEKSTGALSGNIVLGFMLGSAGAIGVIFGFPFDIRHIAFASSHGTLSLMYAPDILTFSGVALILLAVTIVGFVNFIVSFGITLSVAISARHLEGINWKENFRNAWQLAKAEPMSFFLPRSPSKSTTS